MSIPLAVPMTTGQNFVVALQFLNATNVGAGGASVFRDVNGCQSGRNVLFAQGLGWVDFCVFLTGDLVIRAVIDCGAVACPWDCGDMNGVVDTIDFLTLLAQWGTVNPCDIDGGGVGVTDFLDMLGHWGPCN
jgi:hypothetical protein